LPIFHFGDGTSMTLYYNDCVVWTCCHFYNRILKRRENAMTFIERTLLSISNWLCKWTSNIIRPRNYWPYNPLNCQWTIDTVKDKNNENKWGIVFDTINKVRQSDNSLLKCLFIIPSDDDWLHNKNTTWF